MPIFTFEHEATGARVDVILPAKALRDLIVFHREGTTNIFTANAGEDRVEVAHRLAEGHAALVFKRRRVPDRINTPRINQTDHQAGEVLKGYRALEDAGKLSKSTYSPAEVKAAWALPDNPG
jgi:hypothetical protein